MMSLNYIFESNLSLCFFLGFYVLLLKNETSFTVKRAILLSGVIIICKANR
jgi:hypothetical protein